MLFPLFPCVLTLTHGSMTCSRWCSPMCFNLCFMWFLEFLQYSLPLISNSQCCSPSSHVFSPSRMSQWHVPNDVPMCSHPHTWVNDMFPMMFPSVLTLTHGWMTCSQWCSHVFSPSQMGQWHVPNDVPMCSHPPQVFKKFLPWYLFCQTRSR